MLELQNISKSFGQDHVLRDISMTFEQGQTDTLVGGNGTGKTTLFILLSFKNNPGEKVFNAILPQRLFREKYRQFAEQADQILEKVHLKEVENNLASEISYGQQKLLTMGCGLANNADLLLLDEPVAGIDQENYEKIYGLIVRLKEEGKTVIQIEHNHDFVESLSDTVWFLHVGKAIPFKDYQSFIADQTVIREYLN
jgi:branched-chain amino acid transport system ATP-binding protein